MQTALQVSLPDASSGQMPGDVGIGGDASLGMFGDANQDVDLHTPGQERDTPVNPEQGLLLTERALVKMLARARARRERELARQASQGENFRFAGKVREDFYEESAIPKKMASVQPGDIKDDFKHRWEMLEATAHEVYLSRGVIHPLQTWRIAWDYVIAFVLIWVAFWLPLRIAFNDSEWTSIYHNAGASWANALDVTIDCIFFLDILLNFNTAYILLDKETGKLHVVGQRCAIAKRYLSTTFTTDFLGTVPIDRPSISM